MSKFYQEDSSELESEEDEQIVEDAPKVKKGVNFDSDSEGDDKRVVRSLKDKLYLELKEEIKKCKSKLDIEDFSKVTDIMEVLMKIHEKIEKVNVPAYPRFFIRHIILVSTVLDSISPESKKKFSTLNAKAFTKLRQRMKKWREPLEGEITEFMKNPTYEDTEESEEEKEKLDEGDYYSSSSDEEDDEMKRMKNDNYRRKLKREDRRKYWLKKVDYGEGGAEKEGGKKKREKTRKDGPSKRQVRTEKVLFNIERSSNTTIVESFETTQKVNEFLQKTVIDRTHMDSDEIKRTIEVLETLLQVMKVETEQMEAEKKIEILLVLIAIRGDLGKIEKTQYTDRRIRLQILRDIKMLFELIKKGNFEQISTFYIDQNVLDVKEVSEAFFSYLKNADQEWLMAMKLSDQRATVDPNAASYFEHLQDHAVILALERAAYKYFMSKKEEDIATSLAFKILDQMYYISDDMLKQLAEHYEAPEGFKDLENPYRFGEDGNTKNFVYELATMVYQHADAKIQVNTVLLHAFHHAVNDRYYEAKDLLLMSKIAENIKNYSVVTQSLYNRAIVRIGLCAFRLGKLKECEDWLEHVCQYNKLKDLISQNPLIRNEKEERRRYTPPHMHISLDLVETVYYISVVLLETPYFFEENKVNLNAIRSRPFKKEWEKYEKNLYHGPPENNKEVLIEASKKLWRGDWRNCFKMIEDLNIWNKISNGRDGVRERLLSRVKEQAFKCFIFRYKASLETLDFANLSAIFELSSGELKTLSARNIFKDAEICVVRVCLWNKGGFDDEKLIQSKEIVAVLDGEEKSLVIEKELRSQFDGVANQLQAQIEKLILQNSSISTTSEMDEEGAEEQQKDANNRNDRRTKFNVNFAEKKRARGNQRGGNFQNASKKY